MLFGNTLVSGKSQRPRYEVASCRKAYIGIIFKKAKTSIAGLAEKPAHLSGAVTMVNVKPRNFDPTNCAAKFLPLQLSCVLIVIEAIFIDAQA